MAAMNEMNEMRVKVDSAKDVLRLAEEAKDAAEIAMIAATVAAVRPRLANTGNAHNAEAEEAFRQAIDARDQAIEAFGNAYCDTVLCQRYVDSLEEELARLTANAARDERAAGFLNRHSRFNGSASNSNSEGGGRRRSRKSRKGRKGHKGRKTRKNGD